MSEERIPALIEDSQAALQRVAVVLNEYLHLDHPMHWKEQGVPRVASVGPGGANNYVCKGSGCMVSVDSREVGSDWGYEGRLGGFDIWRLWHFAHERQSRYPAFGGREKVAEALEQAEALGLIHGPYRRKGNDLYYLTRAEVSD